MSNDEYEDLKNYGQRLETGKRLEELRRRKKELIERRGIKQQEKEIKRLEHPTVERVTKASSRAGSRALKFLGTLTTEGARSYGKTRDTLQSQRPRIKQPSTPRRSFSTPEGNSISLSGAIASNNWHDSNLMDRNFFGNDLQPQKDLLGSTHVNADLLGSNENQKKKYQNLI